MRSISSESLEESMTECRTYGTLENLFFTLHRLQNILTINLWQHSIKEDREFKTMWILREGKKGISMQAKGRE